MTITWTRALLSGASALAFAAMAPSLAPAVAQETQASQAADLSGPQSGPDADKPDSDKKDDKTDTVYIFGRATELIGTAQAASEGVVGEADFETRPLLRPGELVEVIPGMVAAQHSGGGKANQYYLRGFNLDHGTDFAGSIDGVPLNFRAHPHMNGYLDLNFLIPEVVESVEFHKGTAYASNGDFSAAASADFTTHDEAHENYVETDITNDDEYRFLALGSTKIGDGTLFGAGEWEGGDGAFDNPARQKKFSAYLKYTTDWGNAKFHAALMGYDQDWHATDQMPLRAIQSGLIGRLGTLDPNLGGYTSRYIASAGLDWDKNTSVLVYGETYTFRLFNNPTFFLDQVNGDEFMQFTDRKALGARGKMGNTADVGAFKVDWHVGADIRGDFIDTDGLVRTINRVPFQFIRNDSGDVTLADVWGEATVHWTDAFRTTFGAREDAIWYNFDAIQPENSGSDNDTKFSPKFSAAYTFTDALEGYASYGYAFHTNDPRGGLLHTDPNTGDPVTPSPVFVESRGSEVGLRYQPSQSFNASIAVFELDLDSELIFVGDAGTSEPSSPTKRYGSEVNAFWRPTDWLAFDASGAWSHARFVDVPKDESRIPNALEFVGSAGATLTLDGGWEASARIRYLGKSALIEDNSVRGDPSFLMNVGVSKDFGPFYVGLDILNATNSKDNEIEYYYESQLQGEPAPVADRMIHPLEPRTYRLVLRAKF
ncbi:MAG TPA: TonB-dependent receptor [Hyphomonadaceae bacterium]|nr:TonB-dependent receptor [Hyphomonadaceae bacterium]